MTLAQMIPMTADQSAMSSTLESPVWTPDKPLLLRPHNALCLQGWEGIGYSPEFSRNMDAVAAHLAATPSAPVTLRPGPDVLCGACPLNTHEGCRHDVEEEGWITALDHKTLHRLGLAAGVTLPWDALCEMIANTFRGADLALHCAPCAFEPLGLCATALDRLRTTRQPVPSTPFSRVTPPEGPVGSLSHQEDPPCRSTSTPSTSPFAKT
ncbi:MAG: DUF1284 domain-containing protein [bacterium]